MKKPKILVVGSFVMDLIVKTKKVPGEGETIIDAVSFSTATGGKGSNQAVQAALLGADVTMIGKVGNDAFGNELIKATNEAGVDTRYVMKDENAASGVGNVILEVKPGEKAKNRIIVIPGANMTLTASDVEFVRDIIADFDLVMLQLEIPMEVNEIIAQYAFEKGVPVMLNPAPAAKLSDRLLSMLTYISPNEHEVKHLTGIDVFSDGKPDSKKLKLAAESFLKKGVKNVIITLGSRGVAFINKDTFILKPCIDIVDVVDPTAAGDSFIGAFCTAMRFGKSVNVALDFASFAATITVSRLGAQPSLPKLSEVVELMKNQNYTAIPFKAETEENKYQKILEAFLQTTKTEINKLSDNIDFDSYTPAIALIQNAEKNNNRLHITGIGKPGHVAAYAASLFSSTGTPAYELHGTEAVHGSSGQVLPGDVVIAISNSGETAELKATVTALKANGAKIIGVSGKADSWLAQNSDAFLFAGVANEGDPLNRAPRASITAEIIVLQGLSLMLQCIKNITPEQYIKWHPGGSLGKLREGEL